MYSSNVEVGIDFPLRIRLMHAQRNGFVHTIELDDQCAIHVALLEERGARRSDKCIAFRLELDFLAAGECERACRWRW